MWTRQPPINITRQYRSWPPSLLRKTRPSWEGGGVKGLVLSGWGGGGLDHLVRVPPSSDQTKPSQAERLVGGGTLSPFPRLDQT